MVDDKICVGYALNPKKLRKPNESSPRRKRQEDNAEDSYNGEQQVIESQPWTGGGLADFLMSSQETIEFRAWYPSVEPSQQPFFNVIIHKLTEDIEKEESRDKLSALTNYLHHHTGTILLDPLEGVRIVTSRKRTCLHLSQIEEDLGLSCPFAQPKHVFIEDLSQTQSAQGLRFPLICKPLEACGTVLSHAMTVVVSAADLHMAQIPCVAQEFVDHGGEFFKVYNIDEEVMIFRRESLPDLGHFSADALRSVAFDSRHNYPDLNHFVVQVEAEDGLELKVTTESPDEQKASNLDSIQAACQQTAALIRQYFGLTLFGFDCLLPLFSVENPDGAAERKIVVVDVNYFPSYKEVPDFPAKLRAYLHRLAKKGNK